jgi:hypothetical protein
VPQDSFGVVWIDVQGHEGHVMRGAQQLLYMAPPLLIEVTPDTVRTLGLLDELVALLQAHYTHVVDAGAAVRGTLAPLRPVADLITVLSTYSNARINDTDLLFLRL